MVMNKVLLIAGLCLMMCFLSGSNQAIAEETEEFSFGKIVKITESSIVLSEHDYESDEYVDVIYSINAETIFKNVASYVELLIGDEVEIDYLNASESKIALMITKDLVDNIEDYVDEEGNDWKYYVDQDLDQNETDEDLVNEQ